MVDPLRVYTADLATTCVSASAITQLWVPVNLFVLKSLTENMADPAANMSRELEFVKINNIDANDLLVLSGALWIRFADVHGLIHRVLAWAANTRTNTSLSVTKDTSALVKFL
ncbi:uncharacterized protein TRAVEDRAFT_48092 [Trametes versicolor FP-101664 SS1]|uniref:uncharacterized protein n=1 Tax=Trametes versicolor (strain FP-101664) TaxID=717944 RepID=UPI00046235D1|nr:uncharacterized protein TRAVEDRAFT_48092 [Trametes versicolor FP-101664 SS1]EIW58958.1 hypothetical protein TRAVEDRAFT_48092 [Trametes versicolor FP-101664 SS1]